MTQKETIRELRLRVKDLEAKVFSLEKDRDGFRSSMASMLRESIRIHGEGKYWSMPGLIERFAKEIAKREWWYW